MALPFTVVAVLAFLFDPVPAADGQERFLFVGSCLGMFLLGLVDDLRPVGARVKLLGQVLIASAAYSGGMQIDGIRDPMTGLVYTLGGWSYVATVVWLAGCTNLINIIDGVDGLAAGISLMVLTLLVWVGLQAGLTFAVACAAGVAGALLGFLRYNFPPARIYLGDGGAYFLGFLIGSLSILHSQKGTVVAALISPLFALALPIVDVTLAILRRGLQGVPVFRPDRRHLHHRLAACGWSRTRVVLLLYGGSMFCLVLGFAVFLSEGRWTPIALGVLCLVLLTSARTCSFSRDWFAVGRVIGHSLELRKQTRYALAFGEWFKLEAERSGSAESLWQDFGFIVSKLAFASVRLSTSDGAHWWAAIPPAKESGSEHRRRFDLAPNASLEFTAVRARLNAREFEFLSELSAEMWLAAMEHWQKAHQSVFRLRGPGQAEDSPETFALSASEREAGQFDARGGLSRCSVER